MGFKHDLEQCSSKPQYFERNRVGFERNLCVRVEMIQN